MALIRTLLGGLVGGVLANNPAVLCFSIGIFVGVYTEQAYQLPKLKDMADHYWDVMKEWEKTMRK